MITIPLVWTSPPLHMNQRLHWAAKAREVSRVRTEVAWRAKGHTITPPVYVVLVWTVSDKKTRDTDNPMPTVKACIDGLRDAHVLPEDHSGIVARSWVEIEHGVKKAMRLEVRGVS